MSAVLFQTMPQLSPDEYAQLEASCLEHGIQVPIIVDESGVVIDGHHRQKIAQEHGIYLPTETRDTLTDAEKMTLSISLNIDRRQLSREQRRAIIAASVKAQPEMSNREHGRSLGVSHNTIAAVRDELESTGQVDQLETRTGADGKERPATYTRTETTTVEESVAADPDTGEVIEAAAFTRPAQKQVMQGDAVLDYDAKQISERISNALQCLDSMRTDAHRERVLTMWWPRAIENEEVPPWGLDLFKPEPIRQIAQALTSLANELEGMK